MRYLYSRGLAKSLLSRRTDCTGCFIKLPPPPHGDSEPCDISGSGYLIAKLITAQDVNAHSGGADHSKQKMTADTDLPVGKRQYI